ncbi:MAG: hypothetical protein RL386_1942, partial [Bacteroidota bacterium]
PHLQVGLAPAPPGSRLEVRVSAPFFSPYEVEHQVIGRIENALSAIRGLRDIRSVAEEGGGTVILEFPDADKRGLYRMEVAAKLRSIYHSLPEGVAYPSVEGGGLDDPAAGVAVLEYFVYGKCSAAAARKWAEGYFRKTLGGLEGISDIWCTGGEAEALHVLYDTKKMQALGASPGALRLAVQDNYRGYLPQALPDTTGGYAIPLSVSPRTRAVTAMGQLSLISSGPLPLQLSDVAVVLVGQMPATGLFRVDGREVARVRISVKAGVNSIRAARRIQRQVAAGVHLQGSLHVRLAVDHTDGVKAEVRKAIYRSAASILILLLLLCLSYRELNMALILIFGLGINLSLSLVLGWMIGLHWHPYTLAGLGVAFGLMVDNAIVMLDACRKGQERRIFPALLTATLTTMAALLLVYVLPAEYRQNLGDFALIVFLGLLSSLLTVKWLVPACYRLWAGSAPGGGNMGKRRRVWYLLIGYRRAIAFWGRRKALFTAFWVLAFGLPVFMLPYRGTGTGFLDRLLDSERFQRDFRPHLETFLGGTLMRFAMKLQEAHIFKVPLPTTLFIRAELPPRHTVEHVNAIMRRMEALLAGFEGLAGFYTIVHDGRFGEITVHFSSAAEKSGLPLQVQAAVERLAQAFSGVQWRIFGQGASFNSTLFDGQIASSQLIIKGYDYRELARQAEKTAAFLGSNMRVAHIRTDMAQAWGDRPLEEWRFALDPQRLSVHGIDPLALATAVQSVTTTAAFHIDYAGRNLNVRLGPASPMDLYDLLHQSLALPDGRAVYLKDLGRLGPRKANNAIYRVNRQYIRIIGYEYIGDYGQAGALQEAVLAEIRRDLPPGFSIECEAESTRAISAKRWLLSLLLLPCINFFLCALLFESLRKPLLVLLALPVSFIGIFFVFGAGFYRFDHGGIAAFVLLGGISVNAVIFILQDLEYAPGRRGDFGTSLIKVVFRRSGAILLTVCSTICGFIPFLAAGRELPFWSALSAGTIAGLLMSLLAVFVVVPVLMWKEEKRSNTAPGG